MPRPTLAWSSASVTVAVPSLPTTIPLARLANSAASAGVAPDGQPQGEDRDRRIASARNVEDILGARGRVVRRRIALQQQHAVLPQRDQQAAGLPPAQQAAPASSSAWSSSTGATGSDGGSPAAQERLGAIRLDRRWRPAR